MVSSGPELSELSKCFLYKYGASDWAGEAEGEGNIVISLVSQETGDWHLPPAEVSPDTGYRDTLLSSFPSLTAIKR